MSGLVSRELHCLVRMRVYQALFMHFRWNKEKAENSGHGLFWDAANSWYLNVTRQRKSSSQSTTVDAYEQPQIMHLETFHNVPKSPPTRPHYAQDPRAVSIKMCNYLLLRPVCPTCLRIRLDGPPTDPLITDPTPISICDVALQEQRMCHFDSWETIAGASELNIIGSEQCSMCEQAQAERYLPSATSREMYISGLSKELTELETLDWPNEVRTRQVAGSQGHLLRVIWERQVTKRIHLDKETKVPILGSDFAGSVSSVAEFPAFERKEELRAYFKRIYGASVYAGQLPAGLQFADVTYQDAMLQIDSWAAIKDLPMQVQQLAQEVYRKLVWRRGRYRNKNGRCVLAACVGLALTTPKSTPDLPRLAQMVGLSDLTELDVVYKELMEVKLALEGGKPSVLKVESSELGVGQDRSVRFRSQEEEDLMVFVSPGSSATTSPTSVITLESLMKRTTESERSNECEDLSTFEKYGNRPNNSNDNNKDASVGHHEEKIPRKSSNLSSGIPFTPSYQLLSNWPRVPWVFPSITRLRPGPCGKVMTYLSSASRVSSLTQGGAAPTIYDKSTILKLTEIRAALFVNSRSWTEDEQTWLSVLTHRLQVLKMYNMVPKLKFPEEKWYRLDAVHVAVCLLNERRIHMEMLKKNNFVVLFPTSFETRPHRDIEVLLGHIQCAIELGEQLKKRRTDSDMIQYLAHLLTISFEMGKHALEKLENSDVEGNIVLSRREWSRLRACHVRACKRNRGKISSELEDSTSQDGPSFEAIQSESDDSDTTVPSYFQLLEKATHFYQRWTVEWIEFAKQLQQYESVRRILRVSSPKSGSNSGKRSCDEIGEFNAKGSSPTPKRVRRQA